MRKRGRNIVDTYTFIHIRREPFMPLFTSSPTMPSSLALCYSYKSPTIETQK
jgi:hypothetical protein